MSWSWYQQTYCLCKSIFYIVFSIEIRLVLAFAVNVALSIPSIQFPFEWQAMTYWQYRAPDRRKKLADFLRTTIGKKTEDKQQPSKASNNKLSFWKRSGVSSGLFQEPSTTLNGVHPYGRIHAFIVSSTQTVLLKKKRKERFEVRKAS